MAPAVGVMRPERHPIKVVLPDPDPPTMTVCRPVGMARSIASSARTPLG